jgi:hypothetical protein
MIILLRVTSVWKLVVRTVFFCEVWIHPRWNLSRLSSRHNGFKPVTYTGSQVSSWSNDNVHWQIVILGLQHLAHLIWHCEMHSWWNRKLQSLQWLVISHRFLTRHNCAHANNDANQERSTRWCTPYRHKLLVVRNCCQQQQQQQPGEVVMLLRIVWFCPLETFKCLSSLTVFLLGLCTYVEGSRQHGTDTRESTQHQWWMSVEIYNK